ncbi:tRNA-guanine transglycosylase [Auriculariales sp. MPI-PUGE-AT-0066]|nr:tRNA-guanine transglycosylase [Auriculariales sp. MPI-PUGE-AT-0066]
MGYAVCRWKLTPGQAQRMREQITSRGGVPHLSRDHVLDTPAIRGVHVTYESFLEQTKPIPLRYPSQHPMSDFLGFSSTRHILSLAVRDPADLRIAPPNQTQAVQVWTHRGVRKAVPATFHEQALACKPDLLEALGDAPYTSPPFSQKRLTKSIERSSAWLVGLMKINPSPQNVLVQMQGAASLPARSVWASTLREPMDELGGTTLEERIFGFVFDLAHLRQAIAEPVEEGATVVDVQREDAVALHLQSSLRNLRVDKIRVARTSRSPHEVLVLIREVGIDLFDSQWAQDAAQYGLALDFVFPAPATSRGSADSTNSTEQLDPRAARQRPDDLHDLAHNLYDERYARDHTPFCATYTSCTCIGCAPSAASGHIVHSSINDASTLTSPLPAHKRSYVHHLLRTHEMSAHALLAAHNLVVLDAFFLGIRALLAQDLETAQGTVETSGKDQHPHPTFAAEVERFMSYYDGTLRIMDEGKLDWRDVDLARGKGRLAREKVIVTEEEG